MVHADNLRVHLILKEEKLGPTSYMLQALTEEGFVLDVQAGPSINSRSCRVGFEIVVPVSALGVL